MKKLISALGFILFLTVSALAQNNPIHFGVEAGGTWSSLQYVNQSTVFKSQKRIFYNAGINIEFPFAEVYSISANFRYLHWGDKQQATNNIIILTNAPSTDLYSKTDQQYVDLALLFHYYTQDDFSGLYAVFGPEIGYLLKANYISHDPQQVGSDANGNITYDITNEMYKLNFLANGGIGFVFPDMKPQPYIQFIYALGLVKTAKTSQNKWSTRGLLFNVGVRF